MNFLININFFRNENPVCKKRKFVKNNKEKTFVNTKFMENVFFNMNIDFSLSKFSFQCSVDLRRNFAEKEKM